MDLRDRFAAHFAAALVDAFSDPETLAARAYELAEAMVRERDRRIDQEEEAAVADEHDHEQDDGEPADDRWSITSNLGAIPPALPNLAGLLDDPEPMEPEPEWASDEELPDWLEAPYDPRWELEPRWSDASAPSSPAPETRTPSRPPGPGLARTQLRFEEHDLVAPRSRGSRGAG